MSEYTPVVPAPYKRERTVMVSAPPFGADGQDWKLFRFKNLERVSKTQMLLTQKLEHWLPPGIEPSSLLEKTVTRLTELFEERVTLQLEHLQVQKPKDLRQLITLPTFASIITPGPDKRRGFLEVELGLAHAAIDLLLGGAGEPATLRPLSEIEEGVMTFVVLSALKAVVPAVGTAFPAPKMERIARTLDELLGIWGDESHVLILQLRGTLGNAQGWVRLFLPSSWIETAQVNDVAVQARRSENAGMHLGRLEGVTAWLRAEIGRAEISAADLAGLHAGDVVLMDDISARPDLSEGGTGYLRVGMGRCGRIASEIFLEDDRFHARIQGFERGQEPRYERHPGAAADAAAEALLDKANAARTDEYTSPEDRGGKKEEKALDEGANFGEGGELLNDIPLQIAVELSRVAVTADDVLGLKVGQVIDLNRAPGEPVELSVNGKLIGRGELVEIEGHLGVRVTSLTG